MACCPNGIYPPLIRDCTGTIRELRTGESLAPGSGSNLTDEHAELILKFDYDQGTTAVDSSDNGFDFTWNSTPLHDTRFTEITGATMYATKTNESKLNLGAEFTVAVTINLVNPPGTFNGIIGKTNGVSWSDGWGMHVDASGEVEFFLKHYLTGSGGDVVKTTVTEGEIHRIVVVGSINDGTLKMYVDEVLVDEVAYTSAVSGTTNGLELGRLGSTLELEEAIFYDARIYNRAANLPAVLAYADIDAEVIQNELLSDDLVVYVDVAGDDLTGDGTITNPFKSIFRALDRIAFVNPGNFAITIDMSVGDHTWVKTLRPSYAYASSVTVVGTRRAMATTLTISNIDTAHSTDANFPDLQYFDFDIDLSANTTTDVAVGQFIRIKDATGGTNHDAVRGLHKIIAWNPGTEVATLRCWQKVDVAEIASGAITASALDVMQTYVTFPDVVDDHGIDIKGNHGFNWSNVVIEGNQNQYDARRGVRVADGGIWASTTPVGVHQFDVGVECFNNSIVEFSVGMISKIFTIGISTQAAVSRFAFTSYCNGCGELFAWTQGGGTLIAFDVIVQAAAETFCILCEKSGHVDVSDAFFYFEDTVPTTTACLRAEEFGEIVATGATFTGFTTSKSTTTQGAIEPP